MVDFKKRNFKQTEFMSFPKLEKIEIKLTGRQKRDFVMLSGILATVWLPPPSTTSYELARIIYRPDALDQRLTKYFLTG